MMVLGRRYSSRTLALSREFLYGGHGTGPKTMLTPINIHSYLAEMAPAVEASVCGRGFDAKPRTNRERALSGSCAS
jgi:hypothetical protein